MNTSSKYLLLKQKGIFSSLSEAVVNKIAEQSTFVEVEKGSLIYDQGVPVKCVYVIEKGSVKIASTASCGKTLIKDIIYEGELFGENIFSAQTERYSYAEAAVNTRYFSLPAAFFKELVLSEPALAQSVMDIIIQRLQALDQRMQSFVFKKAKARILDFIKSAGARRGIRIGLDECLVNHGMSHKEIAYLTDTSRQTVSRVLGELKRDKLIHFSARKPGKILIRNFGVA